MVEIFSFRIINDINKNLFYRLLYYLPEQKQARVKRFINFDDAQRALFADILARVIICKKLDIKNELISFNKNKYGKPFLENTDDIQFNISHSGEWVVLAFSKKAVGIDIEMVKPIDFSIAERFFSKSEVDSLFTITNSADRILFFYDLWTLKESYIKAEGKGLSIPLDSFSMRINNNITVESELENTNYFFKQYNIDDKYKLSVCSSYCSFSESVICKKLHEIVSDVDNYFK